jgi:hypothetical protein
MFIVRNTEFLCFLKIPRNSAKVTLADNHKRGQKGSNEKSGGIHDYDDRASPEK